jgi:serine/arginine repetitive matrix protein 2
MKENIQRAAYQINPASRSYGAAVSAPKYTSTPVRYYTSAGSVPRRRSYKRKSTSKKRRSTKRKSKRRSTKRRSTKRKSTSKKRRSTKRKSTSKKRNSVARDFKKLCKKYNLKV